MAEEYNIKQLRWQCRRGIKEVEVILAPFFEEHFSTLSSEMKQAFVELLLCEDVDLFEWLTQRSYPDNGQFSALFHHIFATLDARRS